MNCFKEDKMEALTEKTVLPLTPNEEVMKMLIKAKYFLEHSISHSQNDDEFGLMIFLHSLDNSIEFLLRIIIRHLDIEEKTNKTINTAELASLFGEVDKFLKEKTIYNEKPTRLSYEIEVKKIRELRNNVQHGIILPISEARTFLDYGIRFFEKTLIKIFGLNVEEIAYSTLILDEIVKNHIVNAEKRFSENKHLESIVSCRNAFDYANFIYNCKTNINISRSVAFAEIDKNTFLLPYLKEIDNKVMLMGSGIEISKYDRYCQYIDHIPSRFFVERKGNVIMQRDWIRDDARFCLNFVCESILKWQLNEGKPLYEIDTSSLEERIFVEKINGIELPLCYSEYGCHYAFNNSYARLFYIDELQKVGELKKLKSGITYSFYNKCTIQGRLWSESKEFVQLKNIDINLLSNEPSIWSALIVFSSIPFTEIRTNDNVIDINIATSKELKEMQFDTNVINKICEHLESIKEIDTIEKASELNEIINFNDIPSGVSLISNKLIDLFAGNSEVQ